MLGVKMAVTESGQLYSKAIVVQGQAYAETSAWRLSY